MNNDIIKGIFAMLSKRGYDQNLLQQGLNEAIDDDAFNAPDYANNHLNEKLYLEGLHNELRGIPVDSPYNDFSYSEKPLSYLDSPNTTYMRDALNNSLQNYSPESLEMELSGFNPDTGEYITDENLLALLKYLNK